ncbi:hypothetical protein GF366_03005 [Candidatus Peregrinibacteria bacterium]|nr:hypothetical protein [Candidatus Peregrinibacteria bacterium]
MSKVLKFDTVLALAVLFLLIFGLVMITSIGVPKSISLSAPDVLYPNCSDPNVDCYLLFKKHLFRLFIGLLAFYIAWKLPVKFWKKISAPLYVALVILLVIVAIFGQSFGTIATNWIVFFDTSFQPSEFAKLAVILYLAYWFSRKKGESIQSFHNGFIPFCIISGAMILPIILQNDYGSSLVIGIISVTIFFVAGARVKHIALATFMAMIALIVVVSAVPHVRERFQGFMRIGEECVEDYCWQSQQANIAVGSGGLWGKGLTQGIQKSYWLPQASDDFIFAASAEELGFLRIIFVVIAYLFIAMRGYAIANKASNNFEMFLAVGITTWIIIQAFLNIAVNTALAPVTGITLPFVSYGGSSLVSCLIGVAILLNISKKTTHYANSPNRGRNRRSRYSQSGRYRRA